MNKRIRALAIATAFVLATQAASAQNLSQYRQYSLESSLASVMATSGARDTAPRTVHERPATIKELAWQAPYLDASHGLPDPVQQISFTFYNETLYQIVVHYNRQRTEGLTSADIIESMSASYGPAMTSARTAPRPLEEVVPDAVVLARWESADSNVVLVRGLYPPGFQLILTAKSLATQARSAIREAVRLDALDAPRREAAQREKDADKANAALDKARDQNKGAFRP